MSRIPDSASTAVAAYSPSHRPTWFDCFFILVGLALSQVIAQWSGLTAAATERTPAWVSAHMVRFFVVWLLMPVGLLLFWPLFFLTQKLRGRSEPLTSGEWLWGVAWLLVLPWIVWIAAPQFTTLPESIVPAAIKRGVFLGYAIGVLALGSLALLITLVGLIARWRPPWTHNFCLVLLIWAGLWLALGMSWGIELK